MARNQRQHMHIARALDGEIAMEPTGALLSEYDGVQPGTSNPPMS